MARYSAPTFDEWMQTEGNKRIADRTKQFDESTKGMTGWGMGLSEQRAGIPSRVREEYGNVDQKGEFRDGVYGTFDEWAKQDYVNASAANAFNQGVANQQELVNQARGYNQQMQGFGKEALPSVDALVYQNLRGAASGQDVPFGREQQAALMTDANTRSQSAANNQLQQLQQQAAMTGANPSDPSYQAAMRRVQGEAQGNMQNARNSIAMQANTANYAAKQQATQGLTNLQQQLAGQALANRGQQMQAQTLGQNAMQQALSMPVAAPNYQVAQGMQQGAGQQKAQPGNYQLPNYQQWMANQQQPVKPQGASPLANMTNPWKK